MATRQSLLCPSEGSSLLATSASETVEILHQNLNILSSLAFTVMLQGTWEVLLVSSFQGLLDGGLAGLFWSYVLTNIGMAFEVLSLAEMASMITATGGQHRWVHEFAPPELQRFHSHLTGWMITMSFQAGAASGPFLVGTLMGSTLHSSKDGTKWQGTLFVCIVAIAVSLGNRFGGRALPIFHNIMLVIHCSAFLIVVTALWFFAPRKSPRVAFTEFTNSGGWSSEVLSLLIGQISAVYASVSSEGVVNMSEEIHDADRTVPLAMIYAQLVGFVLGVFFLITYIPCVIDLEGAIGEQTGYPFLFVFKNAFSPAFVNTATMTVALLILAGTLPYNLSSSRQMLAFARDGGLPFSKWIAEVHPVRRVPTNAIVLSTAVVIGLLLINNVSNAAFGAIISLNIVCQRLANMVSIAHTLRYRLSSSKPLPETGFSLGKYGILINAVGFLYACFTCFWCSWPSVTPVTWENFNWAPVMVVATLTISTIDWSVRGRYHYYPSKGRNELA